MHPKVTKTIGNKIWHLEDSGLSYVEAKSLQRHLKKTEEKHSRITKAKDGYRVWWSK